MIGKIFYSLYEFKFLANLRKITDIAKHIIKKYRKSYNNNL